MRRWFVLALGLTVAGGCTRSQPQNGGAATQTPAVQPATQAQSGSAASVSAETGAPVIYVDVRTPEEYAEGHVRGAINIPYDQMAQRWTELQKDEGRAIVLYCRTGHRAGIALTELQQHGFAHAVNGGGLAALEQRGLPVTK